MNSFFQANYILMLLMPLLLITGPFLSDLAIVLFFCSSVFLYFKNYIIIKKNLLNFIYFFNILFYCNYILINLNRKIYFPQIINYIFKIFGLVLIAYFLYSIKNHLIEKLGFVVIFIFLLFFLDSILFFIWI